MRNESKKSVIVDARWDGIDFSSEAIHQLNQIIDKGLVDLVKRHSGFVTRDQPVAADRSQETTVSK